MQASDAESSDSVAVGRPQSQGRAHPGLDEAAVQGPISKMALHNGATFEGQVSPLPAGQKHKTRCFSF